MIPVGGSCPARSKIEELWGQNHKHFTHVNYSCIKIVSLEPILWNIFGVILLTFCILHHFINAQYFPPLHWNGPAYKKVCKFIYRIDPCFENTAWELATLHESMHTAWEHAHCMGACTLNGSMHTAWEHAHCMGACTLHRIMHTA